MPAHPALKPMAPLLGLAVAEVVLEVPVGFLEELVPVKEGDDVDVGLDAPEDVSPASGAVDCPEISAKIEEEKVPDILSRLFRLKIWSKTCE